MVHTKVIEKYEEHVVRTGTDTCWGWTGTTDGFGYAFFCVWLSDSKRYINCRAHRISAQIEHGPLTPDQVVMHLCHNPICSNPKHLKIGTQAENMKTSQEIGALQRKIPIEDMPKIRKRRAAGETLQSIANDYGCSKQAVRHMLMRDT